MKSWIKGSLISLSILIILVVIVSVQYYLSPADHFGGKGLGYSLAMMLATFLAIPFLVAGAIGGLIYDKLTLKSQTFRIIASIVSTLLLIIIFWLTLVYLLSGDIRFF